MIFFFLFKNKPLETPVDFYVICAIEVLSIDAVVLGYFIRMIAYFSGVYL